MKPKSLAVIFAVFVALVLLYAFAVLRTDADREGTEESGGEKSRTLLRLTGGPVRSLSVSGAAGGYVLRKSATEDGSAGGWTVDGAPVSREMAERLDEAVAGTVIGPAVPTRNRENQAAFEIGGPSTITVDVQGARRVRLAYGKPAYVPREYFVRVDDAAEIRTVEGDLRTVMPEDVDDWRQKVISQADPGAIKEVRLTTPRSTVEIRSRNGGWVAVRKDDDRSAEKRREKSVEETVEMTAAESLVGALRELESTEFVPPADLDMPFGRVDLTVESRTKLAVLDRIELHRRPDGRYVARKTAGDGIGERWLLPGETVRVLTHPSFGLK